VKNKNNDKRKNRLFRGKYRLHLRGVLQLLVTANAVRSAPILVTLMMEEVRSSETSVLTRGARRNMPEDGTLRRHRRENLKS
jgi:hypothetical protein